MTIIPPYLQKGDTIGLVCPAGFMAADKVQTCIQTLTEWGFAVRTGNTVGSQYHYFSGTDEQRLTDLQQMLDDPAIKVILCARGGYGTGRIIDRLSFKKFRKHPKWIIGYSDITILHAHIFRRFKIASLHSPMAGAFNDGGAENEFVKSLRNSLNGGKAVYSCKPHFKNVPGTATGKLVGGNLTLLAHLTGTRSDIKTEGKILFIEDLGEYIYNVDRMLYQLKRSGKLDGLAGLIVGSFTEMKDTTVPFGKEVYEIISEVVKDYAYPVCFGFPVGHTAENYALKIGVAYQLTANAERVTLQEL